MRSTIRIVSIALVALLILQTPGLLATSLAQEPSKRMRDRQQVIDAENIRQDDGDRKQAPSPIREPNPANVKENDHGIIVVDPSQERDELQILPQDSRLLDPIRRQELEDFAQRVAGSLAFEHDGTISLNQ